MSRNFRNILIAILVLALVGVGIFFLVQRQQTAATQQFEVLREATVTRDRIASTVNATGAIEPESLVTLTFGLGGTIVDVNAVRGQTVAADDVLAQLDTAELALSVQQAQDALRIQELTMAQRVNSEPSPAQLASSQADVQAAEANVQVAEANLASAQASLQQAQAQRAQLLAGPSSGQLAQAEAQVSAARQQQKQAQETYNRTIECITFTVPGTNQEDEVCPGLGAPEEQARAALEAATLNLQAAEAQAADLNNPAGPADIQAVDATIAGATAGVRAAEGNVAAAEAQLARARAAADLLLEKPSADETAILEAQVDSARTSLELAELRLRQAQLIAPISGTVAGVLIRAGEQAAPGSPAVTILNEDAYHITVNVDEIDIDRVAVGQPVVITLDALPDMPVQGVVSEIAPTSTSTSGVVTYLVTINIDEGAAGSLRPGMSASAAITVDELDGVLVVPNWAVRLNRETGEAFVLIRRAGGTIEEVVVETGLRNEQFSEIVAGLNEGDTVVLTNEREGLGGFFGG
ncbi:MAG: efflux RND transporter periplasmic adaptor subunit [Anaerolineae bacterium]|uniref:efflux RND transporter periplasmic adaptor subunit n=1 Tax=Promineifilum sp. TaxID=2664178 RepID=UPI001D2E8315|nr:efflux RND transporter periplasmic adaptor subunit [Anaerolineales bacterium]MCB8935509.1 efflux RND transporter periplasmic adaptor subunit [Promineifilum sp.]MCO5180562.1 efflux RND transporter periplasmic adaptor subunit [Promineifilum sp.]MCW5847269.1 efflux RND transporter periplasmic adaptor subunit [Anaerolineae bacterium]